MAAVLIRTSDDVESYLELIEQAAKNAHLWIAEQTGSPLELLKSMKFKPIGFHPIEGHALNLVEQINQTWTYLVALLATRKLLELHPEAGGYWLAPGATASIPLDIMSKREGLVGAETFAAVHPRNNHKLEKDLAKLSGRAEVHRYVFFMSPAFLGTLRLPQFEREGVQVWSVDAT